MSFTKSKTVEVALASSRSVKAARSRFYITSFSNRWLEKFHSPCTRTSHE